MMFHADFAFMSFVIVFTISVYFICTLFLFLFFKAAMRNSLFW